MTAQKSQTQQSVTRRQLLDVLPPGLLLTPDFPPLLGGISRYLFNVYSRFDLRAIVLIAPNGLPSNEFDSQQSYVAHRFPLDKRIPYLRGGYYLLRTFAKAKELLKSRSRLIIHCGHIHAAIVARHLRRRFGTPYLVWTHSLEIMHRRLRSLIRNSLCEADLIVTNSNYTQSYIESLGISASKVTRIRPATDPELFTPKRRAYNCARWFGIRKRPILLTVGSIERGRRYKGQDMVIRALPEVLKVIPDILYVVAGGGGDGRYLEQIAEKYGVKENVKLIGRIADDDLPFLYSCCDAFIMCSREEHRFRGVLAEGFGIVFLEASATGKPVIGGLSGGIPDAVKNGITGILVNPTDTNSIADAIVQVFTEPGLAEALGANGRMWVEQEMNWNRAAMEFREVFSRVFPFP